MSYLIFSFFWSFWKTVLIKPCDIHWSVMPAQTALLALSAKAMLSSCPAQPALSCHQFWQPCYFTARHASVSFFDSDMDVDIVGISTAVISTNLGSLWFLAVWDEVVSLISSNSDASFVSLSSTVVSAVLGSCCCLSASLMSATLLSSDSAARSGSATGSAGPSGSCCLTVWISSANSAGSSCCSAAWTAADDLINQASNDVLSSKQLKALLFVF